VPHYDNPGFSVEKIKTKMALRVVKNGLITLKDCRMGPSADCGSPVV
jgi:glutaryl-CoA dehydrogenase